jgi:hypothetical protein
MNKIIFTVLLGIVFSIMPSRTHAWWPFQTITPTYTPTPTPFILQIKPNIQLDKIKLISTVTPTLEPTPTVTNTPTSTPTPSTVSTTPDATGTSMPKEDEKATASNAADATETASPTATTAPAPGGIQTKDIVTYVLIGAILVVLLAQALMPKKDIKPEAKKEGPKISE